MYSSPRKHKPATVAVSTPVRHLAKKFDAASWKVQAFDDESDNSGFFTPRQSATKSPSKRLSSKWTPRSGSESSSTFMTPKQNQSPVKSSLRKFGGGLPFGRPDSPSDNSFETPRPSPPPNTRDVLVTKPPLVESSDASTKAEIEKSSQEQHKQSSKNSEERRKKDKSERKRKETKEERALRKKNETKEQRAERKARKERRKLKAAKKAQRTSSSDSAASFHSCASSRTYKVWEFGKPKSFERPPVNEETNRAAMQIQRIARGGWQRIKFRLELLQYKLDNKEELTARAIDNVWVETQEKKDRFFDIVKSKAEKKLNKKISMEKETRNQGKQIITYLRNDNKKIRDRNENLVKKMQDLIHQNDRLAQANDRATHNLGELQGHVRRFTETHQQLNQVMPMYEARVAFVEEAAEQRQQYCLSEHRSKIAYMKCVANIVQLMEDQCKDSDLVEEIVGYLLAMGDTS